MPRKIKKVVLSPTQRVELLELGPEKFLEKYPRKGKPETRRWYELLKAEQEDQVLSEQGIEEYAKGLLAEEAPDRYKGVRTQPENITSTLAQIEDLMNRYSERKVHPVISTLIDDLEKHGRSWDNGTRRRWKDAFMGAVEYCYPPNEPAHC